MKSKILFLLSLLISVSSFCQTDKIYLHNGTVIDGPVYEVGNFTITYGYVGEKTKQIISKYAVEKIIHSGSNREEKISDKIVINSKDDWEKIVILEDKTENAGLTKVKEIEAKGGTNFGIASASKAQEQSFENVKKAAAAIRCPFVLLSHDLAHSHGLHTQVIRNGVAYKY